MSADGLASMDKEREDVLELAFLRVAAEHSDRPMNLVLPALRISSSVEMDSSSGVSGSVSEQVLNSKTWLSYSDQYGEGSKDLEQSPAFRWCLQCTR